MTENRLQEITAKLTEKVFPFGGFQEVCELVEAVRSGMEERYQGETLKDPALAFTSGPERRLATMMQGMARALEAAADALTAADAAGGAE